MTRLLAGHRHEAQRTVSTRDREVDLDRDIHVRHMNAQRKLVNKLASKKKGIEGSTTEGYQTSWGRRTNTEEDMRKAYSGRSLKSRHLALSASLAAHEQFTEDGSGTFVEVGGEHMTAEGRMVSAKVGSRKRTEGIIVKMPGKRSHDRLGRSKEDKMWDRFERELKEIEDAGTF